MQKACIPQHLGVSYGTLVHRAGCA